MVITPGGGGMITYDFIITRSKVKCLRESVVVSCSFTVTEYTVVQNIKVQNRGTKCKRDLSKTLFDSYDVFLNVR